MVHGSYLPHGLPKDIVPDAFALISSSGGGDRRFFAVNCVRISDPAILGTGISDLRRQTGWTGRIGFKRVTRGSLPFYQQAVDLLVSSGALISCVVADRTVADPFRRFGNYTYAAEEFSRQLLRQLLGRGERLAVEVDFDFPCDQLCESVNHRERRLATGHRLAYGLSEDGMDFLQLVLTAIVFEFLQSVGQAASGNPKDELARFVRESFGVGSCLEGSSGRLTAGLYDGKRVVAFD